MCPVAASLLRRPVGGVWLNRPGAPARLETVIGHPRGCAKVANDESLFMGVFVVDTKSGD